MSILKATKREITGKKVKNIRKDGKLPAVIFGPSREALNIELNPKEFAKLFTQVGYSNIFEIEIEGIGKSRALFKEIQINPLMDKAIHVSIYEVDMKKPITAEVPVVIIGESPAVKNNLGLLVTPVTSLNVHCLPADLPSQLEINIDNMSQVGDSILVTALELPKNVSFASDVQNEMVLAYISSPQKALKSDSATESEEEVAEETK
jgi:large subunit ribosomal protein L25